MESVESDVTAMSASVSKIETSTQNSLDTGSLFLLGNGYSKSIVGALPCNSGTYSPATYPALFNCIGYGYGAGISGKTTISFAAFNITSTLIGSTVDRVTGDIYQFRLSGTTLYVVKYNRYGELLDYTSVSGLTVQNVNNYPAGMMAHNGSLVFYCYNAYGSVATYYYSTGDSWKNFGVIQQSGGYYLYQYMTMAICNDFIGVFYVLSSDGTTNGIYVMTLTEAKSRSVTIPLSGFVNTDVRFFGGVGNACYLKTSTAMYMIRKSGSSFTVTSIPLQTALTNGAIGAGNYVESNGKHYMYANKVLYSKTSTGTDAFQPTTPINTNLTFGATSGFAFTSFSRRGIQLTDGRVLTWMGYTYKDITGQTWSPESVCIFSGADNYIASSQRLDSDLVISFSGTSEKDYSLALVNSEIITSKYRINCQSQLFFCTPPRFLQDVNSYIKT